jgi:hypothetical protein
MTVAGDLGGRDAEGDGGVEDAGAVHVDRDAARAGKVGDAGQLVEGHDPAVAGLLDPDQGRAGVVGVVRTDRPLDRGDVEGGAGLGDGPELGAGDAGGVGGLGVEGVGGLAADDLVAGLAPGEVGDDVAHRAGGDVERGLLAEELGGALLEGVDGRILAEHVIAQLRLGHRPAHLGRRLGDGVGPQIDQGHGRGV